MMETLAKQQKKTLEEMMKIKINFKKDRESRKTKTYLHTRINRLECLWGQLNERDIEIQKLAESNAEHPYFINNFFSDTEKQYDDIRELLEAKLMEIEEKEAKQTAAAPKLTDEELSDESESEVTTRHSSVRLVRVQTEMIKLLERLIQTVQAESTEPKSTVYYQHKWSTMQTYWNKIMSNHTEIVANPHSNYQEYIENSIFEMIEDKYEDIIVFIQEKMSTAKRSEDDIKLPNLILPVFDGDYQAWVSFRDIFMRLIHNNVRLGAAEKMQYLKTHVTKEASSLLQHLTISDANYETAWQLLNDRFENTRKICSSLLNRLLSQPKLDTESANEIRKLHDTTKKCLHALSNLGIKTEAWSPFVCHIIIQKLDNESHKLYEQSLEKPRELPTYEGLFHFLETRFQTLESLRDSKKKEGLTLSNKPKSNRTFEQHRYKSYHTATAKHPRCPYCQQQHKLYQCQKFIRLSTQDRKQFVQLKKLCSNCLTHKEEEECRSRHSCNMCQRQHHTLLHTTGEKVTTMSPQTTAHISTGRAKSVPEVSPNTPMEQQQQQVMLATALVKARSATGKQEYLRALIDQGSQASFISEAAADLLGLPRLKIKAEVSGLALAKAGTVRHKLIIDVTPRFPSQFTISIEAMVLAQLTKQLPDHRMSQCSNIRNSNNIILADPTFDTPGPIDLILGADVFSSIVGEGIMRYTNGLCSQQTEFGWILSGPIRSPNIKTNVIRSMISQIELEQSLKKFWEIENVESTTTDLSKNTFCEKHYAETHIRNQDGSYTVRMPFKDNKDKLGESRHRAVARLLQNEKKFLVDKKLETGYKNFMQEYIKLKHMVPVDPCSVNYQGYYLPHQAIMKESSSTTKLRVVFDASSKTTSGLSLNDTMHAGPKLQNDLTDIVLRWRKHRYVFTADIEKMYRQIKMHSTDQPFLRLLWRSSPREPIQEYQLTTVTYGTAAAPYLAIKTLHQLAQDEKETHPWAAQVLRTDFYVDDLLTGADTLREAKTLQLELISLLSKGGFKLRKWSTNQQSLLQGLPEEFRAKNLLEITEGEPIKALGLHWSPANDNFYFHVNIRSSSNPATKRTVLSDIARLFDPAGWLSPVIIRAKLFMQDLWLENLDWDTPLPTKLGHKWDQFTHELPTVESIKIPRWINYTKNIQDIEIHGFCDASEKAYAAVVYTKILTEHGDSIITMITSKTKVAPAKKQTTLPRLELCAAGLAAKLITRVKTTFALQKTTTYAWSDSQITLAWIQGDTKKWDNFVDPRVMKIRKDVPPEAWHHVKSEDNPADCASRGLSPSQLKAHHLWWTGPKWLATPVDTWPANTQRVNKEPIDPLPIKCVTTTSHHAEENDILTRFSNLTRMLRVLSYCRRYRKATLRRSCYLPKILQPEELHQTLICCIKIVQKESFSQEITSITREKQLPRSSKLASLTPFIDEEGILRVGGRIENAQLSFNQKHTIILPHHHHFTSLVIHNAHMTTLHGGHQATLTYLRQKYWIIDAKSAVRTVIHRCVTCCRYRGTTLRQVMGNLPAQRVTPTKPFTNTGIDYAGPFSLRLSKGRGTKTYKGYIAIFVCLSTKAVHLEGVSDLTTEAFLASYKRFIARRGTCANIYSDCGTTFVGAKNEMEKQFHDAVRKNHDEATIQLADHGTKWHLIPPASPHFGGLWEAGVKSTKYHLRRIAGEINFTFEEFSTLLAQIEACLNSRPICPLSNDPDDLTVLTPGHFLIGRPLLSPPDIDQPQPPIHCLTHWKLISKLQNDFWKAWSSEYLSRLQQRTKWQDKHQNIKVGDIVLLKEENLPPGRWALGRIDMTHPGPDGLVRATIKTVKNLLKRPITKICKLPFETHEVSAPESVPQTSKEPSIIANTTIYTPPCRKRTNTKVKIHPTNIPVRPPIEELRRTSLPTRQAKRLKLGGVLALLNCVLCTFAQPVHESYTAKQPVEIEQFKHNPGIYMEDISHLYMINNIWTIVVYYDLRTYYQQLNGFEECLQNLTNLCDKTISYKYYCTSTLIELQHKVAEMHQNNFILHKRNGNHLIKNRKRRAPFEIIGTAQHLLFGVLDQNYADHIEGEIEKLRQNENYLLALAKNQTSIAEITTNVLRKTTKEIQNQFEVFNNHITTNLNTLQAGMQVTDMAQTFTALATYTSLIMTNYEKTQKELIELITDAHNGKISPFLLNPHQLRDQIKHIREHIPTNLIIPGESNPEDLLHLYHILTVKSRITESLIIFKIQLPLPDARLYQLFKLYPIPTKHNEEYYYIEPSAEYLATDLHREVYYPLTNRELAECRRTQILGYMCEQKHPVYTNQASTHRCEMDLLNHKSPSLSTCNIKKTHPSQYWIQLQHPNYWIFVVHEKTTINIVCGDQVIIKPLEKSGIIRLANNCQVRHGTMSISAQNLYTVTQRSSFLPLTNISTLLAEIPHNIPSKSQPIPLVHLDTKPLDHMTFNPPRETLPAMNSHHIHHYVTTYVIVTILIIMIGWYTFPHLRKLWSKTDSYAVPKVTPRPAARNTSTSNVPAPK